MRHSHVRRFAYFLALVAGCPGPVLPAAAAPANDSFVNRQLITGVAGSVSGSNVGASKEAGEPNHASAGGRSVWYRWVAPISGTVNFDTVSSSFNTLLAVYTGTGVTALTQLAADNDGTGNQKSRVHVTVTAGTEYQIAVDGYAAASGNVVVNWRYPQKVADGSFFHLRLGGDGQVYAWGDNEYGQLGDGTTTDRATAVRVGLPTGLSASAVAAGLYHGLALGSDGNIYEWGADGANYENYVSTPLLVNLPEGVKATAIFAGEFHSFATGSDGKLYAWGDNSESQLGDGTFLDRATPVQVKLPAGVSVSVVAAGLIHNLAIGSDGKLYAWGNNSLGQLGDGTLTPRSTPIQVNLPSGQQAVSIAAGWEHSAVLDKTGQIYSWGYYYCEGGYDCPITPQPLSQAGEWEAVSVMAGGYHSLALASNGTVHAWGQNDSGQLGNGPTTATWSSPVEVHSLANIVELSAGQMTSLARDHEDRMHQWGYVGGGGVYSPATPDFSAPILVNQPQGLTATALAAGGDHDLALGSDGKVYKWGWDWGDLGDGSTTTFTSIPLQVGLPGGLTATAVSAGNSHSLALDSDSRIYAWGLNDYGQLGDGTTTYRSDPVPVNLPAGVNAGAVAAGGYHSLALGDDGIVYAWGGNLDGQLGDGSTTQRNSPVPVSLAAGVGATAVAASESRSLALGEDGRIYEWGNGVLTPAPLPLPPGVGAVALAAGVAHGLILASDGQVYAWGDNSSGQLGDGSYAAHNDPQPVSLPAGVSATAVAAGYFHSLALGIDGKIYAWGGNEGGQLGNGGYLTSPTPVPVDLWVSAKAVAAGGGYGHSLAIGQDGQIYSWGQDFAHNAYLVPTRVLCDGYPNDAFAHGCELDDPPWPITWNNTSATAEAGEPAHAGQTAQRSLWWRLTAPADGVFTLDTLGSSVDARLAVYTGNVLGALVSVVADADSASGGQAQVSFPVTGGTVYRVAVDSATAGDLKLNFFLDIAQTQTINFPPISDQPVGGNIIPGATASSGLAVSYTVQTPTVCAMAGDVLSLLAVGTCTVTAEQPGDEDFQAAATVSQSFSVNRLAQTIAWSGIDDQNLGSVPVTVNFSASSGLVVTLVSLTPTVCGVDGSSVFLLGVGACTLEASQVGDETYLAATPVSVGFLVLAAGGDGGGGTPADGDVPLPAWALILLAAGLLTAMRKRSISQGG